MQNKNGEAILIEKGADPACQAGGERTHFPFALPITIPFSML
jgi:hypothetical protein